MDWFLENMTWILSGVGVALPLAIVGYIINARRNRQVQKSGSNSTNIQVGGSLRLGREKNDE